MFNLSQNCPPAETSQGEVSHYGCEDRPGEWLSRKVGDCSDDSEEKDNFRRRSSAFTVVVPKPIYSLAQLGKHLTA